jgi:cyclophilin family peptidyl-prolyl cis-trans isomerase/HEAT repeat protein
MKPVLLLVFAFMAAVAAQDRALLEAEQAREAGVPALLAAVKSGRADSQMLAARALGRLENPSYLEALLPLLASPDSQVRRAAAGAIAQMRAPFAGAVALKTERDATVRAAMFEAIGRGKPPSEDAEALLVSGLKDRDPQARAGAARGLESLFRLNSKPPRQPGAATLTALHEAFGPADAETRELILLAMQAVGDRDPATLAAALADANPQVRRLGVIGTRKWGGDPSPLVRYEALRVAPSCERAAAATRDESAHVALLAADLLGTLKCDAGLAADLVSNGRSWRVRAHALVSLSTLDAGKAKEGIDSLAASPVWQARAYAAKAARIANDSAVLAKLARDENPNVAIAAMTTAGDAVRALESEHSGLVRAGAERLKNEPGLKDHLPKLAAAFHRLTAGGAMTVRDPRMAVLARIGEIENRGSTDDLLRQALEDRDPAIAALAARILTARTGVTVAAKTTRLPVPGLPSAEAIRALAGATARISLHGLGTITVNLLTKEAPVTVATFVALAEAGRYNGLTFHRVVSNFVIQGGSPGADEYDGRSREFMRDEVGFARNNRGSIGISTRGRDTGDAQIYFNLIDNFRLDRDYTVFASIVGGLDAMDRVQEGDVIDRIEIIRR